MKRAIVTVAFGKRKDVGKPNEENIIGNDFTEKIAGQREAFKIYSPESEYIAHVNALPPECPSHDEQPFAFKYYAIKDALTRGYTSIMWVDSSVVPIRSLAPIWSLTEWQGFWLTDNQMSCGPWTSDRALSILGITRDQAFEIPQIDAAAFALDLSFKANRAQDFFLGLKDFIKAGALPGSSINTNFEVSTDTRVKGHRQDQTAMSVVAYQLRLPLTKHYVTWQHDSEPYYADRAILKKIR